MIKLNTSLLAQNKPLLNQYQHSDATFGDLPLIVQHLFYLRIPLVTSQPLICFFQALPLAESSTSMIAGVHATVRNTAQVCLFE